MNRGKYICEALKAIRKQIAEANGIQYEPSECAFSGECRGTCPACERERQYIEAQLSLKQKAGKALQIVGVAAGMASMLACQEARAQDDVTSTNSVPQKFEWDYCWFKMTGAAPDPAIESQFDEMADFVSLFPNDTFLVVGHSDDRSHNQSFKQKLSEVRARSVRDILIQRGADPNKVVHIGAGTSEQRFPNAKNELEHELNERVTLEFYSKEREAEIKRKLKEK